MYKILDLLTALAIVSGPFWMSWVFYAVTGEMVR